MPRRKQARRTTVRDIRTILRLTHEEGLSVREIAERLKIGKSSVSSIHPSRAAGFWAPRVVTSVHGDR
ncbi:DNA-directed RNA polymerase specialized sigma24 family protein [Sinorhizobium fredii]